MHAKMAAKGTIIKVVNTECKYQIIIFLMEGCLKGTMNCYLAYDHKQSEILKLLDTYIAENEL